MQRAVIVAIIAIIIIILASVVYTAYTGSATNKQNSRAYTFYANLDSYGNDITSNTSLANNITALQATCDKTPGCVAFNTGGWFKNTLLPKGQWYNYKPGDATQGIYVLKSAQI